MKNYSEMSDFEINKAVALAVGYQLSSDFQSLLDEFSPGCVNIIIEGSQSTFNPCNSWADAGTIIKNNNISLVNAGDEWIAATRDVGMEGYLGDEHLCLYGCGELVYDKNPIRAAMIVFLMMQECV